MDKPASGAAKVPTPLMEWALDMEVLMSNFEKTVLINLASSGGAGGRTIRLE